MTLLKRVFFKKEVLGNLMYLELDEITNEIQVEINASG